MQRLLSRLYWRISGVRGPRLREVVERSMGPGAVPVAVEGGAEARGAEGGGAKAGGAKAGGADAEAGALAGAG